MREFCPRKQWIPRGLRPNLLILNKGAITSLSLFKPFSSNKEPIDNQQTGETHRNKGSLHVLVALGLISQVFGAVEATPSIENVEASALTYMGSEGALPRRELTTLANLSEALLARSWEGLRPTKNLLEGVFRTVP